MLKTTDIEDINIKYDNIEKKDKNNNSNTKKPNTTGNIIDNINTIGIKCRTERESNCFVK